MNREDLACLCAPPPPHAAPPAPGSNDQEDLDRAVDLFYHKLMAEASLCPYFATIDMAKQRHKMVGLPEFSSPPPLPLPLYTEFWGRLCCCLCAWRGIAAGMLYRVPVGRILWALSILPFCCPTLMMLQSTLMLPSSHSAAGTALPAVGAPRCCCCC